MSTDEKIFIEEIRSRHEKAFQHLFHEYYCCLTLFAQGYVMDRQAAEDLVQSVFVCLWEQVDHLHVQTSLKSYLYQAVRNRCMNYLRDLKVQDKHHLLYAQALLHITENQDHEDDLEDALERAIEQLPCKMAEIFSMKYLQGKKQKEIASSLNLTENTVKTQLKRARKKISETVLKSALFHFFL